MTRLPIAFAAMLFASTSAFAADLYVDPGPDPVAPAFGGFYLRGHLGMSNQQLGSLQHTLFNDVEIHDVLDEGGFDSAPLAGIGVGYQFNDWLRADAFVEYRGDASFSALDRYGHTGAGGTVWDATDDYTGTKSEWLLMANAYVDIGHWYGITPYVGAGIGASRNTISHFQDVNVPTAGVSYGDTASTWNFAWALHAGLAYQVTDRMTLDLGYSYMNLGDAKTGDLKAYDGSVVNEPMHFKDITSHDIKLGFRYSLQ